MILGTSGAQWHGCVSQTAAAKSPSERACVTESVCTAACRRGGSQGGRGVHLGQGCTGVTGGHRPVSAGWRAGGHRRPDRQREVISAVRSAQPDAAGARAGRGRAWQGVPPSFDIGTLCHISVFCCFWACACYNVLHARVDCAEMKGSHTTRSASK